MKKISYLPNIITVLRIVGTLTLIFLPPLSMMFYIVYTFCGVTDILDGFIARVTNTSSELGAKLDSIADLMFYATMLLKILPILIEKLPAGIWLVVAAIVILRLISYTIAAIKYHRFAAYHTYLNKVTNAVLFIVPYFIELPIFTAVCKFICIISGVSTLEELIMHLQAKEYSPRKTIFSKK